MGPDLGLLTLALFPSSSLQLENGLSLGHFLN